MLCVFRFCHGPSGQDDERLIKCKVAMTDLHEERGIAHVSSSWTCLNQRGKEVMKGHAVGFIRR
jgi:hypothetical protein